ncbi:MAG TPA: fatty acid--CoA ligase family protein [Vicinamibacterales bacterium]|jgi:acyl-CoA synthetase (AMP-forming)/AMP-acid ligase II
MTCVDFLLARMAEHADALAVAAGDTTCTYREILEETATWRERVEKAGVPRGAVVSVEGDYGVGPIAAFLALAERGAVIVPLSPDSAQHLDEFLQLGQVEFRLRAADSAEAQPTGRRAGHACYDTLCQRRVPGLVLFTSGSTGRHKAAVHDLARLLRKFETRRHRRRTLVFLQLDHIGGVNTLLYTLSNGGAVVAPPDRSPASVAACIERYAVELLPTSPTFLNLLLLSGEHERRDLSSLTLITYGTEAMPESTLRKVATAFPRAKLQQTYGLTEVGILRSQSRGSDSLWVRVGGEGYETKVVDGRLWVRAESAMLGYLNAPSPFDADGFLDTGDRVEVDGEWLRILGRESEIINVGGNKVYPAEVEDALLDLPGVRDAVVHAEPNPITGQIVAATVVLDDRSEPVSAFKLRMRQGLKPRLPAWKIPAKVILADGPLHSSRFKRMRGAASREQERTR